MTGGEKISMQRVRGIRDQAPFAEKLQEIERILGEDEAQFKEQERIRKKYGEKS